MNTQHKKIKYPKSVILQDIFVFRNNPRKVQNKRIRYSLLVDQKKEEPPQSGGSLKDFVTILGGLTGFLLAIIWLGGRFYAAGYFSSLNIPLYHLNFSIWEYGEVYFQSFLIFLGSYLALSIAIPVVILLGLFILIDVIIINLLKKVCPKARQLNKFPFGKLIASLVDSLQKSSASKVFFGFIIFSIFVFSFVQAYKDGQRNGFTHVSGGSEAITIYSKDYLPFGTVMEIKKPGQQTMYKTTDLYLLTYNSGKYYLFQDLDPVTCKPVNVVIMEDTDNNIFVVGSPTLSNSACANKP